MSESHESLAAFLEAHRDEVGELSRLGVKLVGAFPEGGELLDSHLTSLNSSVLGAAGVEFLRKAMAAGVFKGLARPAVVDVTAALTAWTALGTPQGVAGLARAVGRGRLRLQGTDGVRGPVSLETDGNPVLNFGRSGRITPEFIEVLCHAFARLARKGGLVRAGGEVVVAQDGRDVATGGKLASAMIEGFASAGLCVIDVGVAPTPIIPFAQAHRGIRLGATLTASHNPATQNGIKFFVDGYKMLPEGPLGDYAVSAAAYNLAAEGRYRKDECSRVEAGEILGEFADYIVANMPAGGVEKLKGVRIVLDPANGSCTEVGRAVFERLGIPVTLVNDNPQGHNINEGGGVAELEGKRRITRAEADGSPALSSVSEMLRLAGETREDVYGLVVDGDGDRGYVVVAPAGGDEALVVDGDAEGFVLARFMTEIGAIPAEGADEWEFVGTVESDIELFNNVGAALGLLTRIECVGDKWLVKRFRKGAKLAVGQEVSGHVLWPTWVPGPDGKKVSVVTGNGLLTGLWVLAAARSMGLSHDELARPYQPGAFITHYTYNVDRSLFFAGSRPWISDVNAISDALDHAAGGAFSTWSFVERPEEADLLYAALHSEEGAVVGAVFVRNSGTENKTGVYARGRRELEPLLDQTCRILAKLHQWTLKDRHSPAYRLEAAALKTLRAGPLLADELRGRVAGALGGEEAGELFDTVLYGMRKEGLVEFVDGGIALKAAQAEGD